LRGNVANKEYTLSLDVIAVATFESNQLHLWDVFSKQLVELDKVIEALASNEVTEVILGFTPTNCNHYKSKEIKGGEALFIAKDNAFLFKIINLDFHCFRTLRNNIN
jgi:hypothetical protein